MDYKDIARLEREKSLGFQGGSSYKKSNDVKGSRDKLLSKTNKARKELTRNFHDINIHIMCGKIPLIEGINLGYYFKKRESLADYLEELEKKGL